MDINEIMVSFWVSYKGTPYRIKKINGDDVILENDSAETEAHIIVSISECEPVKLTPKILIECGFYESKDKFVLDGGNNMTILAYREETDDYSMSVGLCNMSVTLKYVHEFQLLIKAYKKTGITVDVNRDNCSMRDGNYVRVEDTIYRIDHRETGTVFQLVSETGSSIMCDYIEMKPIAISSDIVLLNGFKENEETHLLEKISEEHYSIIYNNNEMWNIENLETGEKFNGFIHYFHQLQNILSMLKISFKMKPSKEDVNTATAFDEVYK